VVGVAVGSFVDVAVGADVDVAVGAPVSVAVGSCVSVGSVVAVAVTVEGGVFVGVLCGRSVAVGPWTHDALHWILESHPVVGIQ